MADNVRPSLDVCFRDVRRRCLREGLSRSKRRTQVRYYKRISISSETNDEAFRTRSVTLLAVELHELLLQNKERLSEDCDMLR